MNELGYVKHNEQKNIDSKKNNRVNVRAVHFDGQVDIPHIIKFVNKKIDIGAHTIKVHFESYQRGLCAIRHVPFSSSQLGLIHIINYSYL